MQHKQYNVQNIQQYIRILTKYSEWYDPKNYSIVDPMIIMIGIGKYDSDVMPSLNGVSIDYTRMMNVFNNKFGYAFCYKNSDNETIYLNKSIENKNKLKDNFKLYWIDEEIDDFLEYCSQIFIKNKHDSLFIIISSHGESEVILTSDGEEYSHGMFQAYFMASEFSNVPKVIFFDACRGSMKPLFKKKEKKENKTTIKKSNSSKAEFELAQYLVCDDNTENKENDTIKIKGKENNPDDKKNTKNNINVNTSTISNNNNKNNDDLNFHLWRRIYANPDGYAAIDGGMKGGYLIRGLYKTLLDTTNSTSHDFDEIIKQVRLKTRKLTGKAATEVVEDVNDIHYRMFLTMKK